MRRRRRKSKYTWFPNVGSAARTELVEPFQQLKFSLDLAPNGGLRTIVSPVTIDTPLEDFTSDDQLVEVLGNEYIVKRIVGKAFIDCSQPSDDPPTTIFPKTALVGCGFFVARANDANSGGGATTPIGSASVAEINDNYGPLSFNTVREPWMWRRVWILATGHESPSVGAGANTPFATMRTSGGLINTFPTTSTIGYGSVLDGPHFDVKSARRVRQDERLWFAVSARVLDSEWNQAELPNTTGANMINGVIDYRVLGALRKAHNSSTF